VRCTFASINDAKCITCHRRGTNCISQELPEEPRQVEDSAGRIVRVEALLQQLVKRVDDGTAKDGTQSTLDDAQRPQFAARTPVSDFEPGPSMSLHEPSPVGMTLKLPLVVTNFRRK
jgi:hypothetical protein